MIAGALLFRMLGVLLCTAKTHLLARERIFCMLSYTPKATVQAAIGAIPLSLGFSCGQTVLTAAVLSILLTAPLGAIAILPPLWYIFGNAFRFDVPNRPPICTKYL